MNKIIAKICFLIIVSNLNAQLNKSKINEIDNYLNNTYKEWGVPAIGVAIINKDSVFLSKGYGFKNIDKKEKFDAETLFGIASLSKSFTAAAIMKLQQEGKLSLNDKVITHLPWFKAYNSYVTDNMTIKDLLSHRSGLRTFSGDLLWYATNYSRKEVVERSQYLEPVYGFREQFGYSNIHYIAAGLVIEKVSGISWDEYIKINFFDPLEMSKSNTSITQSIGNNNIVTPYAQINDKNIEVPFINWDNAGPAGSINSNLIDLSKYMRLFLNKGIINNDTILTERSIHTMWSSITAKNVSHWKEQFFKGTHFSSYGLGFESFDFKGYKINTHSGGMDGMISQMVFIPELNISFVILTNCTSALPNALMWELLDKIIGDDNLQYDYCKNYLSLIKQSENKDKKIDSEENLDKNISDLELKKFVGLYQSKMYGNVKVEIKNNNLFIQFIPTPDFYSNLTFIKENTFKIKLDLFPGLPEGTVEFILIDNEVNEMKIDIPNPDFYFTELKLFKIE